MRNTYECDHCGATLDVVHRHAFGQLDLHTDIAYCEDCAICYEADRQSAMFTIANPAATSLYTRTEAVDDSVGSILQEAFQTEAAWASPIKDAQDAETIRALIESSRVVEVRSKFKGTHSDTTTMPVAEVRLTVKTKCPLCDDIHIGQVADGSFAEAVGFKNKDASFRCRCGRTLEPAMGSWACDHCGRTYGCEETDLAD